MAKIVITIEDDFDKGEVRWVATPNFETMLSMEISGHQLTSAHAYAIQTMQILQAVKQKTKGQKSPILNLPKLIK